MDIFNAVSKQIDSAQSYGHDYAKTSKATKIEQPKETQQNASKTNSTNSVKGKQNNKEIQKKLSDTVKKLNDQMSSLNIDVKFGFNDKIDTMFVDVTEKSTGQLIRTIPSKETMQLAEKMKEVIGMIFDKKG